MKFASQIGLAIVAILALVAGVTFVSQYSRTPVVDADRQIKDDPPAPRDSQLHWPELKITEWEPKSLGECEVGSIGHYDYWFDNPTGVPVDLSLQAASCKCSAISAAVLPKELAEKYRPFELTNAVSELASVPNGLLGVVCRLHADRKATSELWGFKLHWTLLQQDSKNSVIVPPGAGGIVRIAWEGRKEIHGMQRLMVNLITQPTEGAVRPRAFPLLELPVAYVPMLRYYPIDQALPELGPNEEQTATFICWSSERAGFPLTAREESGDAHVQVTVEPIGPEESWQYANKVQSRILAAYRVNVKVRERVSDSVQMDLGPFTRRIVLESYPEVDKKYAVVNGSVRGDVTVGAEQDKGKVNLGAFKAANGGHKPVAVVAKRADIDLKPQMIKIEPANLEFLKARLEKTGTGRWTLDVRATPGCPPGPLPKDAAVVISMPGSPPRAVRIPVSGIAYQ